LVIGNKASAFTISLPPSTGTRRVIIIGNINTGVVTIQADTTGTADTIDGESSQTLIQYESMQLVDYNNDAWIVV
jgi:hypothetical protein